MSRKVSPAPNYGRLNFTPASTAQPVLFCDALQGVARVERVDVVAAGPGCRTSRCSQTSAWWRTPELSLAPALGDMKVDRRCRDSGGRRTCWRASPG